MLDREAILEAISMAVSEARGISEYEENNLSKSFASGVEIGLRSAMSMVLAYDPLRQYINTGFAKYSRESVIMHERIVKERLQNSKMNQFMGKRDANSIQAADSIEPADEPEGPDPDQQV